ncbi:MAG: dTDP-4-amino-4,6-dideoxygalactose transaminase [Lentisphaerae bacterium]|jgi:dTDP-4-amino-4,6-dideoxygalactose transaminase|nr:dTDP-4-amino-4,6-dideoxygalactose transaminase [Lentisphaerota bacterium]
MAHIPFNKPFIVGKELYYIAQAVQQGHLAGDGSFTKKCNHWLEEHFGARKALLTHSCTAALEMAAILCDIQPGDEFIVPSFTFVSTVNAFVLRGGVPVFVDIRPDTLNLDENLIEAAITPKTKAIVPVHYAGVGCNMDAIMDIARRHDLLVVEDAAQGVCATYKDRFLGTIGHLGCFSFHETKNFISGEGGALLINDERFCERAEIIREKGTNRSQFFRGMVDKYTWVDIGSSYLPSEIIAAFLYAQLEESSTITEKRMATWKHYHALLEPLEQQGFLRRPVNTPETGGHNAHMYYILLPDLDTRTRLIRHLKEQQITAVFHYIPLHTSPMGIKLTQQRFNLPVTDNVAERLLRLPCYFELTPEDTERVVNTIAAFF